MLGAIYLDVVEKMDLLELRVLKNEKCTVGAAAAKWRMMARRGAAWVEKGKARTATCGSVVGILLVVICMVVLVV